MGYWTGPEGRFPAHTWHHLKRVAWTEWGTGSELQAARTVIDCQSDMAAISAIVSQVVRVRVEG